MGEERTGHDRAEESPAAPVGTPKAVARIPGYLWDYALNQEDLIAAAEELSSYLAELARSASITVHAISARAKGLASYEAKSSKTADDGSPKYANPATEIYDCVAARVIVFTTGARDDFVDLIVQRSDVVEHVNPGLKKYNGYDSEHLIVKALKDEDARLRYPALSRYLTRFPGLEIQVRSVAAHAWAEYEHDVRYKAGAYQDLSEDDRRQIDQWFIEAGGMRRVMDSLFSQIESKLNSIADPISPQQIAEWTAPSTKSTAADDAADLPGVQAEIEVTEDGEDQTPLTVETLTELIRTRYPQSEVGERSEVEQLVRHLRLIDIDSIGGVEAALADVEPGRVARLMDYPKETVGSRRLDDELLASLTRRYVEADIEPERIQLLRVRLRRVGGKFAIYSVRTAGGSSPLMTAAGALRLLAAIVAGTRGPSFAEVDGVISADETALNPSAKAKIVRGRGQAVYVASNLTRAVAEETMSALVSRIPGSGVLILRGGDILLEATDE